MSNTPIPLGTTDSSRSVAETPDIRLFNRYFEKDPTNLENQVALLTRPALRKWLEVGDGPIRGLYSQPGTFDEAVFTVSGDTLYRIDDLGQVITTVGTLGGATGYVSMAATDTYLFIADGTGLWYYSDNDYAKGTLTASGAILTGEVVRMGSMYYQFTSGAVDTGTPLGTSGAPWLVKLGATTAFSLMNLSQALEATGTAGTTYNTTLTANTEVALSSVTATTLLIHAQTPGTGGNALVTTETGAAMSWGAGTLAGGGGTIFATVVVPDGDGIISVGVIIGFVICVVAQGQNKNGRFYWIQPATTVIDPLDFATAERSPDPLWNVLVVGDQFWLPGPSTTEVWYPTGDGDAPFIRQQGRLFDKGIWEGTAIQIKDAVMAVGTDGVVYQIGAEPVVVSTPGIAQRIREAINAQRAF